jgi:chemotaxis methyl-accepting protein methylase
LDPELRDRIRFQAHDIFRPQESIPGKTVIYFLRAVLHNWNDKYACRILQAIVPAMKHGDRIVLCELIIPEPGTGSIFLERFAR